MLTIAKPLALTLRNGLAVCVLATVLSACGSTKWGFPYRADIQQGNWVTAEQVARLEKGMTREQVRYVMGTSTLEDAFHANRWDYPYYNRPGYGDAEVRRFTVWFENDQLVRWDGDEQPNYQPFQSSDPNSGQPLPSDLSQPEASDIQTSPVGLEASSVLESSSTPNEPAPQPLR